MSVRIVARVRPQQKNEFGKDVIVSTHHSSHVDASERPNVVKIPNPKNEGESFAFQFSSVYDSFASQQDVFDKEVSPSIKSLFSGIDVTIFAYGSTGTGKTHTMRGGKTLADRGIIPRLLSGIYRRARKVGKDSEGQSSVEVTLSYYEIYNDKVYDLFEAPEERTAAGLPIRDNGGKTVVVGLTERACASLKDFEKLYDQANINRSTSATKLNATSSRSHAILAIKLTISSEDQMRISTASAIDLAGSEDNRRTENGKERMVESASINKSLFTLAKCVEAISQNQSRIPYRESKMTRILSLGQNKGLTIMILNLAPVRSFHLDSLSSLNFANRTKKIEVREVENEPIFKGCARGLQSLAGGNMKRQPLRPLTNTAHNVAANPSNLVAKQTASAKSFTVYSDMKSTSNIRQCIGAKKRSSPLKRPRESSEMPSSRPVKRRSFVQNSMQRDRPLLSKQAIEDLIERKVADALAAHALDQPPNAVEPEISDEVRRRLDSIEQKIKGQEHNGREQGLTFLLCAKQHAVRGEDRSALAMYKLAKDYFPNNSKLEQKIERLQSKLQGYANDCTGASKSRPTPSLFPKKPRKSDGDEDYDDRQELSNDDGHESDFRSPQATKRKKVGKMLEVRSLSMSTDEAMTSSPGTRRLLQIIDSRDVAQISRLRGVGPKRAENIIEALSVGPAGPLHSLSQLGQLKGVGLKLVGSMRAGLQDISIG